MRQRIARSTTATARTAHASAMPPSRLRLGFTFDQCAQGRRLAARAQPTLFTSREEGQGDEDREIDHRRNHAVVGLVSAPVSFSLLSLLSFWCVLFSVVVVFFFF